MDDSCDDLFAISDEETLLPVENVQSNPVEEHLLKQLTDVENRIDNVTNEIADMKATTAHILNALQWRALYGQDLDSDSDTDVSLRRSIRSAFNFDPFFRGFSDEEYKIDTVRRSLECMNFFTAIADSFVPRCRRCTIVNSSNVNV